jgi:membrane protease YdiL (CAAX protease family)
MDNSADLTPTAPEALKWPDPPPPPPSAVHTVFFGRFGLRAGWSVAIFVPVLIVIVSLLGVATLAVTGKLKKAVIDAMSHSQTRTPPPSAQAESKPKPVIINEALQFAATGLASLALALIERRRMAVYGIGRNRIFDFIPGAFFGLASLSLLIEVLHATHVLVFDSQALHGAAIYAFGLKWLLAFLLVGLFEEYLTRGFLQYTLTRGLFGLAEKISAKHARFIAFWLAALVMSLVFGAGHLGNPGENRVGIVMVFLAGIVFSYALWRTGSLWWAIGFHMAWDWAQSFLFGVPDSGNISAGRLFFTHPVGNSLYSGGVDGPEGSVYVIPVMLLVGVIIRFTTMPGEQPPLDPA